MEFTCKNCGKPHGVMTVVDGEMFHLTCVDEIEIEIEELVLEE